MRPAKGRAHALRVIRDLVGGCQHPTEVAPAEPPAIPVSHPVSREVTDYVDFTGQTDSVQR